MSLVKFIYKGSEIIIQCQEIDKMKDIINKFVIKVEKDINNLYFMYNGNIINIELKYKDIINETDKKNNIMKILVEEYNKEKIEKNKVISKDIICPECKENIFIKIDNYKINLMGCKNRHKFNNILINEFENTQIIDISKIICDECKINNKSNTYKNEMYKCIDCDKNICLLCKTKHEKIHRIINYEFKNYICNIHNEYYIKYCYECKKSICLKCEQDHKDHLVKIN